MSTSAQDYTTSGAALMLANVGAAVCAVLLHTILTYAASMELLLTSDLMSHTVVSH